MTLTEGEKLTDLWRKLEEHYTNRLQQLREINDRAQTEMETAQLRGRISEVKSFLAMTKEQPIIN